MTPAQFKRFAHKNYASALYPTVLTAADLFFPRTKNGSRGLIFDLCSGPGLCAKVLAEAGYHVICYDHSPEYVRACNRLGSPRVAALLRDVLTLPQHGYPSAFHNGVFINASGYFSPQGLQSMLRDWASLGLKRLVANFFVEEDQKRYPPSGRCKSKHGLDYVFDLDTEQMVLTAIKERSLLKAIGLAGWSVTGEIHYADFKHERMLLLEVAS